MYARLATQPRLNRGLVAVGGFGKIGFFTLTVIYAIVGDVPISMAVNATPDLILGSVFLWWARVARMETASTEVSADSLTTPS